MMHTVTMPDIGEGVVEGEVIQWLKQVGEPLKQDEPVVVLMTDKATVELPAPRPGKLAKQYYKPGDIAIKDKPLYDIEIEGEEIPEPALREAPKSKAETSTPISSAPSIRERSTGERALAIPAVRKLAEELEVDINRVTGSGNEGRVTAADLKQHLQSERPKIADIPIPHFPDDQVKPLQGIRRLTARRTAASKATIPHFSYCDSADATALLQFRDKTQLKAQQQGLHLTFTPLFIRALSLTLKRFPEFNASYDNATDALVIHRPHHIGIAMKTPLGLIVPVLRDVDTMTFEQTVRAYDTLRKEAIEGKLKPGDMKDSTITLSNFGTEGGRWATPVINPPEVAILATAKIHPEPLVKSDQIVIRHILHCSWSFDHRVIDGDMAAAFSNAFIHAIENPLALL